MSPVLLLLTLSLTSAPAASNGAAGPSGAEVADPQGVSVKADLDPVEAEPVAMDPVAEVPPAAEPVAEATDAEPAHSGVKAQVDDGSLGRQGAPLPSAPEVEGGPEEASSLVPHVSVVPSRAVPVKWAGIGITAVGIASYLGGQLVMDAADRMPVGPAKQERFEYGQSIRGGGLGAVITGVSIWFISNELARWEEAPAVGFVPVRDGGAVTFSVRLP